MIRIEFSAGEFVWHQDSVSKPNIAAGRAGIKMDRTHLPFVFGRKEKCQPYFFHRKNEVRIGTMWYGSLVIDLVLVYQSVNRRARGIQQTDKSKR